MTAQAYQQLIVEGIKGLPQESLAEIAHFVYFVRKRILHSQDIENDLRDLSIELKLAQLSRDEEDHLMEEFDGYDKLHPQE
jgi:hypothetical protein